MIENVRAFEEREAELPGATGVRRIDLLIELSHFVSKIEPERARRLAAEALDLAGRSQDELRTGRALQALAMIELDAGGGLVTIRSFDPFFTTKPADRGTGLGFYTVRDIVVEHGGRIEVNSAIDLGTTFTVYLPRGVCPPGEGTGTEPGSG